jgi:aminopeptidase-like protein
MELTMFGNLAYKLIEELYLYNRNFCSTDYDKALAEIHAILPLKIHHFTGDEHFNGWMIPPKWDLVRGQIRKDGKVIFEATHPLHVIGLSKPFSGFVSKEELQKHLHCDARFPDAIPYHFRQNYRPWERDWGFCVSKQFFDALEDGIYQVDILTNESEGYLKIAEHTHVGANPETFVLVAHLDHGGMANDDLAGVAVAVEIFHHLLNQNTKFTYRLVLVQEIIGSAYYLGKIPHILDHVLESCFLEMLGSNTPFALQHSYGGKGRMEQILANLLKKQTGFREGPFRSIICNDEMVWESYGIPMSSLSRFPYPEYHCDKDNPSIITHEALHDSVKVFLDTIEQLEKSTLMRKKFEGVLSVANPQYNLYIDPGQSAFGLHVDESQQKLRLLMDILPILPKERFIEQIAEDLHIPLSPALNYLQKWQEKGLVELI